MRALHVIGRTIFGGVFLYSGINHLQKSKATGAVLIGSGLGILAGVTPRQGLALIGAALAMMAVEERRDEEMFVRIGGRDLRSLPA
jgi:hypothetical protein